MHKIRDRNGKGSARGSFTTSTVSKTSRAGKPKARILLEERTTFTMAFFNTLFGVLFVCSLIDVG